MSDLISRADAIEAIKKEIQDFEANYMHAEDDEEYGHDIGFVAGLHRAKTFIRSLSSAEFPKGDLISKAEVLETYADLYHEFEDNPYICKELHTAEADWIPCSERLPNEGEPVLGTFKFQDGYGCQSTERIIINGKDRWFASCGREPVAWMPLPKPYREDGE